MGIFFVRNIRGSKCGSAKGNKLGSTKGSAMGSAKGSGRGSAENPNKQRAISCVFPLQGKRMRKH